MRALWFLAGLGVGAPVGWCRCSLFCAREGERSLWRLLAQGHPRMNRRLDG